MERIHAVSLLLRFRTGTRSQGDGRPARRVCRLRRVRRPGKARTNSGSRGAGNLRAEQVELGRGRGTAARRVAGLLRAAPRHSKRRDRATHRAHSRRAMPHTRRSASAACALTSTSTTARRSRSKRISARTRRQALPQTPSERSSSRRTVKRFAKRSHRHGACVGAEPNPPFDVSTAVYTALPLRRRACDRAHTLALLGIGHMYASPYLKARPGSEARVRTSSTRTRSIRRSVRLTSTPR